MADEDFGGFGGFGDDVDSGNFNSTNLNIFGGGFGEPYDLDPSRYTVVGKDENGQPIVVERDPGVITGPGSVAGSNGAVGAGASGTAANPTGTASAIKKFFSGDSSAGTYAAAAMGVLGLLDALQKNKQRKANQVSQTPLNLNKYKYTSSGINKPAPRAYGAGVMGQNYGGAYSKAAAPTNTISPTSLIDPRESKGDTPETFGMAAGGLTNYLRGKTDGMADKLDTSIEGVQPAKLSHGEFVVPADVVAHLGNGNSEAGADVLYKMLDRVREARTGNKKQGKKINPNKFMPGGIASLNNYAAGGQVAFEAGGTAKVSDGTVSSSLSPWAQGYVGDMLEKGAALSDKPYEAYGGQLTAGTSPLQQQGFKAAGQLGIPAGMASATSAATTATNKMGDMKYNPLGSDFNATMAQQYMNPYLQASLNPQLEEARRQAQIIQMQNAAKATQAGALGGSGRYLMDTETQRNLGQNLANITAQGYNTAYDKAAQQFNADQARKIGEGQFGTNFGLQAAQGQLAGATTQGGLASQENAMGLANLNTQLGAGATQSAIEQANLDAERGQFQESQLYPYKQLQFQQSLLTGLPISAQTATDNNSIFADLASGIGSIFNTQKAVDAAVKPEKAVDAAVKPG
jgi:hypothetical protein